MTAKWLQPAWETETGSPSRKGVLMVLADHADEFGFSYPRVATIARASELGERTVRRILGELEDDGLIRVIEEFEDRGRQTSNTYQLLIPLDNQKREGVSLAGGRVPQRQGRGATAAPSTGTPIEPPVEVRPSAPRKRVAAADRVPMASRAADHDHDDEAPAPAHGSDPDQQQRSTERAKPTSRKKLTDADRRERIEAAARQRSSTYGHACHMLVSLEERGLPNPVNLDALTKTMNKWLRDGVPLPVIGKMVDLFVSSPEAYTHGDKVAWISFQGARERLRTDAEKVRRSTAPAKQVYGGAYDKVSR